MSMRGISGAVVSRLWMLIENMRAGVPRAQIIDVMAYDPRVYNVDIGRLHKVGIKTRLSRREDTYTVEFPSTPVNVKLSPEEFFWLLYTVRTVGAHPDLARKLQLAVSSQSQPVHDCGPAYGIAQNVTGDLAPDLAQIADAITQEIKVVFQYEAVGKGGEIRIVHPYQLIHTPISWYMVGWCEERRDFRNFKLTRISGLKTLSDQFKRVAFALDQHLGDAWWLRHDPRRAANPYQVRVLFTGEASRSILDYRFHRTQKSETTPEGTIVSWQLSYLNEFASWLLQWLPNIEILEPAELKDEIVRRISSCPMTNTLESGSPKHAS